MGSLEMHDDHYIAYTNNAHIRTSQFEDENLDAVRKNPEIEDQALVELIYDKAFSKTAVAPVELEDDVLICRYLTPAKFIKFIDTRQIAFPSATQFDDKWECVIPEDYDLAVLRIFAKLNRSGTIWEKYVKTKASSWNISCWTELDTDFNDHLMWKVYAEGNDGIGITIRYGQLKKRLLNSAKEIAQDGQLHCGRVNYETISLLPFNKHYMFRNEKEIRFAFQSCESKMELISVDEIFDLFGVRISPAAEPSHAEMICRVWLKYGGVDRIQCPT
jgi:hypothetical protein